MSSTLRILHCLRAPIGGLFRHVHDLAVGQAQLGCEVGIVCDSRSGGDEISVQMSRLIDNCALGVTRIPMRRQAGFGDWATYRKIAKIAAKADVQVLHGHGAKGGAYARLAGRKLKRARRDVKTVYTPHGGSLHYSPSSLAGRLYVAAERRLAPMTDGMIFESLYAANRYAEIIGMPKCPVRIIPNGLYRHARKLNLGARVSFAGPLPARTAFARARCVVVPSRAESFPYIVLEAAAAQMPMIATNVGGIKEIVGDSDIPLIPPRDVEALAGQLRTFLASPKPYLQRAASLQQNIAKRFTVEAMTWDVVDFYISELGAGVADTSVSEAA